MFYDLFVRLYPLAIALVSPFNSKAKAWAQGRKNIFDEITATIKREDEVIWLHCASLGEFEQGRPLIEGLRAKITGRQKIVLTFFSPSGYEVQKDYPGADHVFYLPMDSAENARRFFDAVHPVLILFIKYEYWYYYLREARLRNVPLLLVSGIFRDDQPFFKWYGSLHRQMLLSFTYFFVQNKASADLLKKLGIEKQVTISGDTRFDRVIKIAEQFKPVEYIAEFCGNYPVIVAGSTWTEDDKELAHFVNTNPHIKFIIAPHNVIDDRVAECLYLYKHAIKYSQLGSHPVPAGINTLIIDNIGMLSRLYFYARVCYVGGAFNSDGVHNVLEPAVYGKPVVFGPVYDKYFEAVELIEAGGAESVDNALELEEVLDKLLVKDEAYEKAAQASRKYVYSRSGSTNQIMEHIYRNRLLIS